MKENLPAQLQMKREEKLIPCCRENPQARQPMSKEPNQRMQITVLLLVCDHVYIGKHNQLSILSD